MATASEGVESVRPYPVIRTHPERVLFPQDGITKGDLDPSTEDFEIVRSTARRLRGLLNEVGLPVFVMTTGSRGLHLTVPLERHADFDTVRAVALEIAVELARRDPERLTTEQRKEARHSRLYLDVGRNAYAQTGVAPYAVRALPGAPVATPLDWQELEDPQMHSRRFTLRNLPPSLAQRGDPWQGIAEKAATLEEPRRKLAALRSP